MVKTLVMEDESGKPLIVLMHGDRKVSTKNLARNIGCKSVEPCKPDVASRHSGWPSDARTPTDACIVCVTYCRTPTMSVGTSEA